MRCHPIGTVFQGCLLFMPNWWHTFFIGLFPMFFNSRDSQFIIWCPAWAPDLRVIDMPVRRLLLMSSRPLLVLRISRSEEVLAKLWTANSPHLRSQSPSVVIKLITVLFKKIVFRKWLTCMEYVFQITKETPQNINLDFQLKATYGIDF